MGSLPYLSVKQLNKTSQVPQIQFCGTFLSPLFSVFIDLSMLRYLF